MNGSTVDGICNSTTLDSSLLVCNTPENNSLLFDENIPVLTDLDSNDWASGLLHSTLRMTTLM